MGETPMPRAVESIRPSDLESQVGAGGHAELAGAGTLQKATMTRRTRNMICIWVMALGFANLVAYTVAYAYMGGDAHNGEIRDGVCYVRGHFLHGTSGAERPVSRGLWIYSYLHSISIWPSIAAVLISNMILARPHIIATMKEGLVSGDTFVTVVITLVTFLTLVATVAFTLEFIRALSQ